MAKKVATTGGEKAEEKATAEDIDKKAKGKRSTRQKARRQAAGARKPVGTCFVMLPFREPFDMYNRTIICPAIAKAGLTPEMASDLFRPSPIVADIWEMIQKATVLLAVLTTKNANVFYELGLAHALGKPVVLVSETMDDVPFDLQQLRVLLYDKDDPAWGEKLGKAITQSLKETLKDPASSVPGIFAKKVESQAPTKDATTASMEMLERRVRSLELRDNVARFMGTRFSGSQATGFEASLRSSIKKLFPHGATAEMTRVEAKDILNGAVRHYRHTSGGQPVCRRAFKEVATRFFGLPWGLELAGEIMEASPYDFYTES